MKSTSLSATNPCHLWDLALALHELDTLGTYYSGYPAWKLLNRRAEDRGQRSEDRGRKREDGSDPRPMSSEASAKGDPTQDFRPPTSDLRLPTSDPRIQSFPFRTLVTYSLLKLPSNLRPSPEKLFPWQDYHFDKQVAKHLEPADFIHAMPGQALHTFRRARELGIKTVLNHASGPVKIQQAIVAEEQKKWGLPPPRIPSRFNDAYFKREAEEYALADFHCVASTIVKEQLHSLGIPENKIWVLPYSANPDIFYPKYVSEARPVTPDQRKGRNVTPDQREGGSANPGIFYPKETRVDPLNFEKPKQGTKNNTKTFKIVFAGQLVLRKGIPYLLEALKISGREDWELHCYGPDSGETHSFFESYDGLPKIFRHGPVSQIQLAEAFRQADVLVLPSAEEAFGLVVPQALSCALPCIVSDRVGAKDLIRHQKNGAIFSFGNSALLAADMAYWEEHPRPISPPPCWNEIAEKLLSFQ